MVHTIPNRFVTKNSGYFCVDMQNVLYCSLWMKSHKEYYEKDKYFH